MILDPAIQAILFAILVAGVYLGLAVLGLGKFSQGAIFIPIIHTRIHKVFYGMLSILLIVGPITVFILLYLDIEERYSPEVGTLVEPGNWQVEVGGEEHGRAIREYSIEDHELIGVVAENITLLSTRRADTYTKPEESISFKWNEPFTDMLPSGMIFQIYIDPAEEDRDDFIICRPIIDLQIGINERFEYQGVEQYISFNQLNTIVWDLTGIIWATEDVNWQQLVITFDQKGHSYYSPATRLRERLFDQVVVEGNTHWDQDITYVGLECVVSASQEYTDTVESTSFVGDFVLVNAYVVPYYTPDDEKK